MLFSSLVFLWFFLPVVLIASRLLPLKGQNGLLLIASLLFYAWGEPKYLLLMLASITINYLGGLWIAQSSKQKAMHLFALSCVVFVNIALLGYFKYYTFTASALSAIWGAEVLPARDIILPIGISFYTFQAMSYLFDLYRGKIALQKSWFRLALYISFFPQLIAGPIVQYSTVEHQLSNRSVSAAEMNYGIKRFLYGLAKKVILSNAFATKADEIFALSPDIISTPLAWLGAIYYTLQIYYDFSGYSDMAIGLGQMFGFTFPENFNYPYLSRSVTEFWRRWHISLSTWFRTYLYIPLGGNRKGTLRTLCNLFIVFTVTGLWHGANWQYVAWGVGYGILLIAERLFLGKWLAKLPRAIGHGYTLLCVVCAWVIFRAPGLRAGAMWLKAMFIPTAGSGVYPALRYIDTRIIVLGIVAVLLSGIVQTNMPKLKDALYSQEHTGTLQTICLLALGFLSVMLLVAGTYNPFIYFQF